MISGLQGYQLARKFQSLLDAFTIRQGNLPVIQIAATCAGATLVLGALAAFDPASRGVTTAW